MKFSKHGIYLLSPIIILYDIITLPLYLIIQKPWKRWQKRKLAALSYQEHPKELGSSYTRVHQESEVIEDLENLNDFFSKCVHLYRNKPCIGVRKVLKESRERQPDGKILTKVDLAPDYDYITYAETEQKIEEICKSLAALGLKEGDRITLFAETRAEWLLTALACFQMNIIVATLFSNLGDDGLRFCIEETDCEVIVTSQGLLPRLKQLISKESNVKKVVYMEKVGAADRQGFNDRISIFSFSEFINLGKNEDIPMRRISSPDDVAVIMYTSGSTGMPKGVLLSHKNVIAGANAAVTGVPMIRKTKRYLAFLPLAHIMELSMEMASLICGLSISYSSPTRLTDTSTEIISGQKGDATVAKPDFMVIVPLLIQRIQTAVAEKLSKKGPFAEGLFQFGLRYKRYWMEKGFDTPLINKILFKSVKDVLGGEIQLLGSGSAPLSPSTCEFAQTAFGARFHFGYGLTETSGASTVVTDYDLSVGTVGLPAPDCFVKLENWSEGGYHVTDKPNPRGEVVIGGPGVSLGYYKNEQLNKETFYHDGTTRWMRTGDIGEFLPDGRLKIIDRKKDLVKLQHGEYVSLGKVEAEMKSCPLVENICFYGDSLRDFGVALVQPNKNLLLSICKDLGIEGEYEDIYKDKRLQGEVEKILKHHAKKSGLNKFETPQKVSLVKEEWLPPTGLVTAVMKLRRKNIQKYYEDRIEEMYLD